MTEQTNRTGTVETAVKPSNWNVPNALTTLRILLVPFYGWALLVDAVVVAADGVDLVAEPTR